MARRLVAGILTAALALAIIAACGGADSHQLQPATHRVLERGAINPKGKVGLVPRGSLPYNNIGDIWAEGTTIFLAGRGSGRIYIIDASNPDLPVEIARITNAGFPQDVKAQNGILYSTNEDFSTGIGLRTFDVSDPWNPVPLGVLAEPGVGNVHNVYVHGNYAYLASDDTGRMTIADVSNPSAPFVVGSEGHPSGTIHDMMAREGVCYAAFLDGGFSIIDVSVPSSPNTIGSRDYSGAFTHNIWPSDDGNYVFTTDENSGGHVRAWDISDLSDIRQVGSYEAKPNIIVHNVVVRGPYAYIAYYVEGLHIVDVADPSNMKKLGSFDTYPGSDSDRFAGAWGVYPFTTPYVYVSDLNSGLYIFEFQ